jgi:heme exporter protein CcmD
MPNWFSNPHALYVIVAYGVAFVGLWGLLLISWAGLRRAVARDAKNNAKNK